MRTVAFFAASLWCAAQAAAAQPAVTLEAATGHGFYRELADNEVHLEARIAVAPTTSSAPATRNIAFVLDRSGSMAGDAIAAERQAALAAIGRLGERDFVSVIAFGSEVEPLIEARPRGELPDLAARLSKLEPAGGAALYDALNQAAALLRRNAGPQAVSHIVLVTDGPATKGPREAADFTRLAEAFAREGLGLSTIGLGSDFEEDALAAMARAAHGQFQFAATPADLAPALTAAVPLPAVVAGRDATLTIEFSRVTRKLQSHGWRAPVIAGQTMTWSFSRLLAGQSLSVLVSAEVESFHARLTLDDFAAVRLRWIDEAGQPQEISRRVPLRFSTASADVRESVDRVVARADAAVTIREGLQQAIEQLDRGDPRRAWRVLRSARIDARDLNFELDDAAIDEMVRHVDAYLAESQARTMGPLDRKLLRSGLGGRFDPPAEIVEPKD